MRQQLNENPLVQAALIGVLAIGVAFLLLTRLGGGEAEEPPPPAVGADAAAAGVPATDPAAGASPAPDPVAPGGAPEAIGALDGAGSAEAAADPPAGGEFAAGPGLPRPVVNAYEDGRAVALLITRKAGIEDGRLRAMLVRIGSVGNVAVFHAYARDIARYSRITGGVDVSRVPALVIIRPRDRSESDVPLASVRYGFRGPASTEQAVRDALYDGRRDLPYHPR